MSSHLANPDFDEFSLPVHVHQRRIRHILSIQIRNFTPFPLRDAFTSSLAASGPPLLDAVDDIELTLSRRLLEVIWINQRPRLRQKLLKDVLAQIRVQCGNQHI
ncbi:hypothetical protein PIIN_11255 [Serendipita indica DSM 11827]|uniref:Uncharacterized protein n=1 Tax=Serendipita indica (strain DSM 11827) TaxID=1109443 RepID=G4U134_SERID|nr:hypothetical protein PIIN_11255 [Serendipita indica DSM 11827]